MYDTIYFKLDLGDCGNEDFLRVAARYLDPETILDAKGMYGEFISGGLGGLRFTATKTQIKLKEGSLCITIKVFCDIESFSLSFFILSIKSSDKYKQVLFLHITLTSL